MARPPKPTLAESLDALATKLGHDAHLESVLTGDRAYRERMGLDLDELVERYWDTRYRMIFLSALLSVPGDTRPGSTEQLLERAAELFRAAARDIEQANAYANALSKKTRHQLAQRIRHLRFHDGAAPRKIVVMTVDEVQKQLGEEAALAPRPASAVPEEPRDPQIEAAIFEDPYDPIRYGVYADWLQDHGHPRGELIALQMQAVRDPAIRARAEAHFERHIDVFLGPLVDYVSRDVRSRKTFTWQFGFIHSAFIVGSRSRWESGQYESPTVMLRDLLEHPSGRFLTELEVTESTTRIRGDNVANLQPIIDMLIARRPPALRVLRLGGREAYDRGDLSKAWPALASLRELDSNGTFRLGDPELPRATRATIKLADDTMLDAVARAKWPALASLGLGFYRRARDNREKLCAWLATLDLPALVELRFEDSEHADDIAAAIVRAPIRDRLRRLTFARCQLTAEGARVLAAAGLTLDYLDIRECRVNVEGLDILRRITKQLEFQPQWR